MYTVQLMIVGFSILDFGDFQVGSLTSWWWLWCKVESRLSQHEVSRISYKALATKPTALLTAVQCTRKLCCTQLMQIMHIVQHTNEMLHNQQQGVSILTAGTPAQCREERTCSKCYIGWPQSATAPYSTHNSLLSAKCALCSSPHTQHTIHCWLSRARRYRAVLTKNLESFPLLLLTASPPP